MDKFILGPKLKIPPVSSRTMLMMQQVSDLPEIFTSPSTVQNDKHFDKFVNKNAVIFDIPEVTDGIFSSEKRTIKYSESTWATNNNATIINNDLDNADICNVGESLDLENSGLQCLFPVINNGNNAFFFI